MLGLSKQGERGDSKAAGVERMQGEAKVAAAHQAANNIHPSMQPGGSRNVIGQKVIKRFFCVFVGELFVCDVFFCCCKKQIYLVFGLSTNLKSFLVL